MCGPQKEHLTYLNSFKSLLSRGLGRCSQDCPAPNGCTFSTGTSVPLGSKSGWPWHEDRGDSERRGGQRALQIWSCATRFLRFEEEI